MRWDFYASDWTRPSEPISGPQFLWSPIDRFVGHYQGSGGRAVPLDIAQHLRNMHHGYLVDPKRGYSLGYNGAVVSSAGHPLDGTSWEIRGDRFRCAANAGINTMAFALLIIQVDNERLTPKALAKVRDIVGQARLRAPRHLDIVGHGFSGSTTPTSCPGAGITWEIRNGLWEPVSPPLPMPEPEPEPPEEEDDMPKAAAGLIWRHPKYANHFWIGPGGASHLTQEMFRAIRGEVPTIIEAHDQTLKTCLHQCGLTEADLVKA